jgi:hypothetical protein
MESEYCSQVTLAHNIKYDRKYVGTNQGLGDKLISLDERPQGEVLIELLNAM